MIKFSLIKKYLIIATSIIITAIFAFSAWFIYEEVYKNIILSPSLRELQIVAAYQIPDMNNFDIVSKKIMEKIQGDNIDWATVHDPFKNTALAPPEINQPKDKTKSSNNNQTLK